MRYVLPIPLPATQATTAWLVQLSWRSCVAGGGEFARIGARHNVAQLGHPAVVRGAAAAADEVSLSLLLVPLLLLLCVAAVRVLAACWSPSKLGCGGDLHAARTAGRQPTAGGSGSRCRMCASDSTGALTMRLSDASMASVCNLCRLCPIRMQVVAWGKERPSAVRTRVQTSGLCGCSSVTSFGLKCEWTSYGGQSPGLCVVNPALYQACRW